MFSRDGKTLARSGWFDVTNWRPDEDRGFALELPPRPNEAPEEGLERLGFNADGTMLVGADTYHDMVFVWNVEARTRGGKHVPGLASAGLSPDDRVLATTTEDTVW